MALQPRKLNPTSRLIWSGFSNSLPWLWLKQLSDFISSRDVRFEPCKIDPLMLVCKDILCSSNFHSQVEDSHWDPKMSRLCGIGGGWEEVWPSTPDSWLHSHQWARVPAPHLSFEQPQQGTTTWWSWWLPRCPYFCTNFLSRLMVVEHHSFDSPITFHARLQPLQFVLGQIR